ncbi:hypothetical protein LPJ73_000532 [Coemansia sp. RSA 2703]|nr:hypothetical protein LPJ73_000532 [Coemansia sp. RSA 2703]KAJ2377255.1 hypothetical protein IW150_001491 [Coemansia sp. RSA 2607]KAJ2397372.1 hypothetical protein GGI05_000675 [Coemansia sp. RSA 2603]
MKFNTSISLCSVLASVAFAGKCAPNPSQPVYTTSVDQTYVSSPPSYSSPTSVQDYTTTSSAASSTNSDYYTSVENPYTTVPVETYISSSSVEDYTTTSSAASSTNSDYYTTVENPYSTKPVDDYSSTSSAVATSNSVYYTSVENPYSTFPVTDYSSTAPTYTSVSNAFSTMPASSQDSSAAPTETPAYGYQLTLDQLNAAIPARAASDSCASVAFPDECATNAQALPAINAALSTYGITKRSEAVAVIALMAFESDSWQYNINHWPGRAGQGTKAMLMANFITEYAKQLHAEDAQKVTSQAADPSSDATLNALRALVLNNNDSFGSGFWYLVNKAAAYHNSDKLQDGDLASFKDYVLNGVGASWDDSRGTIWSTVNSAISA